VPGGRSWPGPNRGPCRSPALSRPGGPSYKTFFFVTDSGGKPFQLGQILAVKALRGSARIGRDFTN
jgi:hypothetical protein